MIEPDPMDEEAGWYVMNCVAGSELALLEQAKYVTKDLSTDMVEKLVVPLERKLRSHGKNNVVETKVMYPGYVFCKMRINAETYEPLQQLPLCRSWMAGTVNQKGYKKLPPAPIALSDEEVEKFRGLEKSTDDIFNKYGEDYTGRGDDGSDLLGQYEGYEVENMVKVLEGNFKGEDGVVRRLKDGQVCVRLYTYGNVLDQWFKPDEIRPMTDAEAMKGLGGPTVPLNQDAFDESIGKKPKKRDFDGKGGRRGLRSDLMQGMSGGDGRRMRRQDRQSRGETGRTDIFGRTDEEQKQEEENWRIFREEQRMQHRQKRGDMWGIKERTSWDGGDENVRSSLDPDHLPNQKSAREERRESQRRTASGIENALESDSDWSVFANDDSLSERDSGAAEDDFFESLIAELSDNLDEADSNPVNSNTAHLSSKSPPKDSGMEDDFFDSLMADLSSSLSDNVDKAEQDNPEHKSVSDEDDFFSSLEEDLLDSLESSSVSKSSTTSGGGANDDFFSNLEAELTASLSDSEKAGNDADDFFDQLENKLNDKPSNNIKTSSDEDNAFSGVDDNDFFSDLEKSLDSFGSDEESDLLFPSSLSSKTKFDDSRSEGRHSRNEPEKEEKSQGLDKLSVGQEQDLNKLTVAMLKEMLRERGLKVSGKKSELIGRLSE